MRDFGAADQSRFYRFGSECVACCIELVVQGLVLCVHCDLTLRQLVLGIMDILNLLGIGRHPPTTVPGQQDRRGGKYYEPLSFCAGLVPCFVYP